MKKTPCEMIVWTVLPCIRKKLAKNLLGKGLSQKEIAEKLGVSNAAISQYITDKRGGNVKLSDEINGEIEKSANAILNGEDAVKEICRICKIIKEKIDILEEIC